MKIWLRYTVGIIVGIVAGALLPLAGGDTQTILMAASEIIVRIARLMLFPMIFFAAIIAVDELRDDRSVLKVAAHTVGWSIGALVLAAVIGVLAVTVLQPQRIPPLVQQGTASGLPNLLGVIADGLPPNLFRVFVLGDNALVMILVTGILVGWNLRFDREITSPVSLVADSANRILYRLNAAITEVLGVLLAVPAGMMIVHVRRVSDLALFAQFLLVVASAALFVGVVVYPLVIYALRGAGGQPLRWLHMMSAPALAALVSGDVYVSLATFARVEKENLGHPRRIGGSAAPVATLIGRAGSTLVSLAGFLLVVRSYTALEITFGDLVVLMIAAVFHSMLLSRYPASGVLTLLGWLAVRYGRGMEDAYFILLPVIPILERIGAWLDAMTTGFVTEMVARSTSAVRAVDRTV